MMLQKLLNKHRTNKATSNSYVPRRRLADSDVPPPADGVDHSIDNKTSIATGYTSRRSNFRRNQTLTGSSSANIASASENAGQIQSPRAAAHHLRKQRRSLGARLGLLLGGSLALVALLYQLVATVHVDYYGQITDSTDTERIEAYEQKIDEYLSSRPLERLRPLLDVNSLTTHLQANDAPEVREITSVAAAEMGAARVTIKLREPIATWTINGKQQYVDKEGAIFSHNHYANPDVSVIDESGVEFDNVRAVTSTRFLEFIGLSVGYAKSLKLPIGRVVIPADTTRQVQFELSNRPSTRIKLSVDRPVGEQVEDAARAYRFLSRDATTNARLIDVRVSGKAFYL